jgi:LuxR family maltose regulon positive regulatory protein
MDGGRWAEAAGRVEAALSVVDKARMRDYATSVLAFAAAARLAVHRGDMEGANRELTRAMRARPTLTYVFPYLAVRLRLQLAKMYWAIADYSAARHLLREIDDITFTGPPSASSDRRSRSSAGSSHRTRTGDRPAGRP